MLTTFYCFLLIIFQYIKCKKKYKYKYKKRRHTQITRMFILPVSCACQKASSLSCNIPFALPEYLVILCDIHKIINTYK